MILNKYIQLLYEKDIKNVTRVLLSQTTRCCLLLVLLSFKNETRVSASAK